MLLGINIDHVATLRQARGTVYPEPIEAARIVEQAGADSITVHLREDRRHIQDQDVFAIKEISPLPLNLEMALTDTMLNIAESIRPAYCCMVPERREELTTEGGLNVKNDVDRIAAGCQHLQNAGIRVSLFIDADAEQIEAASQTGARCIEIHTGHYAEANTVDEAEKEKATIVQAVMLAVDFGLQVNAGHGLNYANTAAIAAIPNLVELNIGHSIIARSIFVGLPTAVEEMRRLIDVAAT